MVMITKGKGTNYSYLTRCVNSDSEIIKRVGYHANTNQGKATAQCYWDGRIISVHVCANQKNPFVVKFSFCSRGKCR